MTRGTSFFIDEERINNLIEIKPDKYRVEEILAKALELKGLSIEDAAVLLNIDNEETLNKLYKTAKTVKEKIYGKRIVLFAPLYASNYCMNNCLYCAFRRDNKNIVRKILTVDEVLEETRALINQGHKRLILLTGEDNKVSSLDYIEEIIKRMYEEKIFNGEIRRININIAPLSTEEFRRLNSFGIGTYQLFQETYHREIYKQMHPSGMKANYEWRVDAMGRALEAGLNDVGIGPLFGLADYRFETLATLMHADHLDKVYGVGPHTISVPRIEHAEGVPFSASPPHAVKDVEFKKIIAVLRLAVPYTGLVLSTRERPAMRKELLELGISQMSAGSKTNPGGYEIDKQTTEQFESGDHRSLDEVVYELCQNDFIPSFCTSCYRLGRVGKDFMEYAKPGLIQQFCQPNALSTFKEYLEDYAGEKTKAIGESTIQKHLSEITNEKNRGKVQSQLAQIEQGKRDLYI